MLVVVVWSCTDEQLSQASQEDHAEPSTQTQQIRIHMKAMHQVQRELRRIRTHTTAARTQGIRTRTCKMLVPSRFSLLVCLDVPKRKSLLRSAHQTFQNFEPLPSRRSLGTCCKHVGKRQLWRWAGSCSLESLSLTTLDTPGMCVAALGSKQAEEYSKASSRAMVFTAPGGPRRVKAMLRAVLLSPLMEKLQRRSIPNRRQARSPPSTAKHSGAC